MLQDLLHALRVFRGAPGVTAAALLALALGVGANSAIFSAMDAVVLRPLPYPHPERLVTLNMTEGKSHRALAAGSWPQFRDWLEQSHVFDRLGAYQFQSANLTGAGEPERVHAAAVTPEFFDVLGVPLEMGTGLTGGQQVLVTHRFWAQHFGALRGEMGRTLVLDGRPHTLAGVLPPSFRFPLHGVMADEPDVFVPVEPNPSRRTHYLRTIGRLKPGVTLAQAQADLDVVSAAIERAHPRENRGEAVVVGSLHRATVGGTRGTFQVFLAAVGLVLLIACANVSNLLLSQAVSRRREIAIRLSLGATRGRLVRQFLVESVALSLAGGGLGLLLALWLVPLIAAAAPACTPFSQRIAAGGIALNWEVLGFALAVSFAAGILFGIVPAWDSSRPIAETARSTGSVRLRGVLIAAEIGLSLVLLTGASLMMKSFWRMISVDPGFRTEHLLAIDIDLPELKYQETGRRAAFARDVIDRLAGLPGVTGAAVVNDLPLSKQSTTNGFAVAGGEEMGSAGFRAVSPSYFGTMGIPLRAGRFFTAADTRGVMVINEAMARRYWPNDQPIGKVIETPRVLRVRTAQGWDMRFQPEQFEIVGIAGDVLQLSLDSDARPEMYMPFSQMATDSFTFVLRGTADLANLGGAARRQVWAVDSEQPLASVRTMDQLISTDVSPRRFVLLLVGAFAAIALVLAAAGIFAVVRNSVQQRTREIGIRMALGAGPRGVVVLVVRQLAPWIVLGMAAGVAGGLAGGQLLGHYLFHVSARDPATLGAAAVALGALASAAAAIPARAAARVDPAAALRAE